MSHTRDQVQAITRHPRVRGIGRSPAEQLRVDAFAIDLAAWLCGEPRQDLAPLARVVTVVAGREFRTPKRMCRGRALLAVEAASRSVEALWPLLRDPEPAQAQPEADELAPPPEPGRQAEPTPDDPEEGSDDEAEELDEEGSEQEPGDEEDAPSDEDPGDQEDATGDPEEGQENATDEQEDGAGEQGGADEAPDDGAEPDGAPPPEAPQHGLESLVSAEPSAEPELAGLAERLRKVVGGEADALELGSAAGQLLADGAAQAAVGAIESDRLARHLERFLPGVGWSVAAGALHRTLLHRLDLLARLLDNMKELRDLADALGRLEEATREEGHLKGGSEEVTGVTLGGDVDKALPCELGLLGDPATEDLFYQRMLERRLVSLELTGSGLDGQSDADRRGPVIACIDTSGSMRGAPEAAAKALVLAICRRVLPQGRTVHLILFGGPGQRTELRLQRGLGGLEGLTEFLGLSFHAGTDYDGPLVRAAELLEEEALERADILVVTDGLAEAQPEIVQRVQEARELRGAQVWSVVLDRHRTGGVEPFSDEIWQMDPWEAARAVGVVSRFGGTTL